MAILRYVQHALSRLFGRRKYVFRDGERYVRVRRTRRVMIWMR
jgi:hypothetical protein